MKPSPWHSLNPNGPRMNPINELMAEVDEKFRNGEERWILNKHWFAVSDRYPVSPGHVLVVPSRPMQRLSEMSPNEWSSLGAALEEVRKYQLLRYAPDGVNIGVNQGEAAGQTVSVLHIHCIPRYDGDMDDPRGGVRGVIPEKRIYEKKQKTTKSGKKRKNPWESMTEDQRKERIRKMQKGRGITPKFDRKD